MGYTVPVPIMVSVFAGTGMVLVFRPTGPPVLSPYLPEFNHELQFPIAVMTTSDDMAMVKISGRLTRST